MSKPLARKENRLHIEQFDVECCLEWRPDTVDQRAIEVDTVELGGFRSSLQNGSCQGNNRC